MINGLQRLLSIKTVPNNSKWLYFGLTLAQIWHNQSQLYGSVSFMLSADFWAFAWDPYAHAALL